MSAVDKLARLISGMPDKGTTAYEGTAEVVRIEGDTAWVHVPGGVTETPVKLTIDASPGDKIQVKLKGGRAWIEGNHTAPPTDDKKAKEAIRLVERVREVAGKTAQYFWHEETGDDTGAHITERPKEVFKANPTGGNLLLRSVGVAIRDGLAELVTLTADGMVVKSIAGTIIAHLGYGDTQDYSGNVVKRPYFSFGTRDGNIKGSYSTVMGTGNEAAGYGSLAVGMNNISNGDTALAGGWGSRAIGNQSFAYGLGALARSHYQAAVGKYNVQDFVDILRPGAFAFIVGNGEDDNNRRNAFAITWDGDVDLGYDPDNIQEDEYFRILMAQAGITLSDYIDHYGMISLKQLLPVIAKNAASDVLIYDKTDKLQVPGTINAGTDSADGLLNQNQGEGTSRDVTSWNIEGMSLSRFRYLRVVFRRDNATYGTKGEFLLPIYGDTIPTRNIYISGTVVSAHCDRNRLNVINCAVDATQSKFCVTQTFSLYGTAATTVSDMYVEQIYGCY